MSRNQITRSVNRVVSTGLALCAALSIAACSSTGGPIVAPGDGNPPPQALLPALPDDGHGASAITVNMQNGSDAFDMSAGASISGTDLHIQAAAGALEWGMWQNDPAGKNLVGVLAALAINSGDQVWIGLANYALNKWELAGPFPASGATQFDGLNGPDYKSPIGNFNYFLVIAWDGSDVNVASIEFSLDDAAPLVFDIAGNVTNSAGGGPLEGVTITIMGSGDTSMTNASGDYIFPGMPAGNYTLTPSLTGFTFAPQSQNVTIGPHALNVDFVGTAEAPQVTYTNTIKGYLDNNCVGCHNSGFSAGGVRLDTYAEASANGAAANDRIQADTMPPSGGNSAQEQADFQAWIDGGMVE